MIRLLVKALYGLLLAFVLVICIGSFLFTTTPGLYTTLKLGKLFIPGKLSVRHLSGSLAKNLTIGEIEYHFEDITVKINDLTLNWDVKGIFNRQVHINDIRASKVLFNTEHKTPLHVVLKLPFALRASHAEVDALDIQVKDFVQHFYTVQGQVDFNQQGLALNALTFDTAQQAFAMQLSIAGDFPYATHAQLQMNSNQSRLNAKLSLDGDFNKLQWIGEMHGLYEVSLKGALKEGKNISQQLKWRKIEWSMNSANSLKSPEGSLNIQGTLPKIKLDVDATLLNKETKPWVVKGSIQGELPWSWHLIGQLNPAPSSSPDGLMTQLSLKGDILTNQQGHLDLTIAPGIYRLPKDSLVTSLPFKGGQIRATLSSQGLIGNGSVAIDDAKKLSLDFKLPNFNLSQQSVAKQTINANLSLQINTLDFLNKISPDIANPSGTVVASLKATGALNKLVFETALNLTKASLSIPILGLKLDNMNFSITGKHMQWQGTGSIESAGKQITLQGQGPLSTPLNATIKVSGSNFPLVNTKEYQIHISPQLELKITPTLIHLSGAIQVPYARILPQTFTNSTTLSDDVVFVTHQKTKHSTLKTSMDVHLEMGNDVELSLKGLHASLIGGVNLTQQTQGSIRANGELSVKKGQYKAYGQDLNIDQGQLLFTGGPWDSPGINLRASKKVTNNNDDFIASNQLFDFNTSNLQTPTIGTNVTVGVEVTGRLTSPRVLLFSVPAILSQADILSMLVLGRPASQANKAGGQLLLAAISSMNIGSANHGAQLIEQLKQNLGFDFNVKTTTSFNQRTNQLSDSTSFVVGKSLSKRIYLSYNVGLSQADPNVFTLKYLLNKFLSIQVSTSESGNGIDVFYTRSKEKAHD